MKFLITSFIAILLSACANKQLPMQGRVIESTSGAKMNVSAELLEDYTDSYNVLLQINFESKDGRWIRVDEAEVSFENDSKEPYNVIVGKDLVTWAEAKAEQKKMNDYNTGFGVMSASTIGGAAVVMGILTNSKVLTTAGVATVGSAVVYNDYKVLKDQQKTAQGLKLVPEGHLYSPFVVPSMSFVKRWVLINCPSGSIGRVMKVKIKTIEGDTLSYNIELAAKS